LSGRIDHRDGTSGNKTNRLAVFVGMVAAGFATDIERRLLLVAGLRSRATRSSCARITLVRSEMKHLFLGGATLALMSAPHLSPALAQILNRKHLPAHF